MRATLVTLASTSLPFILFIPLTPVVAATDFARCLNNIRDDTWRTSQGISDGGTDNYGNPIPLSNVTTSITYTLCKRACGSGPEPIQWSVFSQQFSSWLLPWLALVSQLPFGANDNLDNLIATLLTVGSPTLAAYSLALTVLNGRWIARRFASCKYPNTRNAVRILSSLQQSPLKVTSDGPLLPSLVVLPENDEWWAELVVWLDYTYTWSIASVTSIAWVIIAYIFTLIDSFTGDIVSALNANGQAVGSVWLWLLPIVVGWLQISPKCDSVRLRQAVARANQRAYVASDALRDEPQLAGDTEKEYAISLIPNTGDLLRRDEACTVPIYNYARFLPWVQAVETVAGAFHAASRKAQAHHPVNNGGAARWVAGKRPSLRPGDVNRVGTKEQIMKYCVPNGEDQNIHRTRWGPNVWSRMFIASVFALLLQWGTTGAAVVVFWFTPTTGLGCRSGSYILYAIVSTLVWLLLLISSVLSHYVTTSPSTSGFVPRVARLSSIWLRRFGKVLAACNAVGIVLSCMFQFSNFFDRCYCNSSVLSLGKKAYLTLKPTPESLHGTRNAWIGGVILATGTATIFVMFVNIFINPPLPAEPDDR